MRLQPTTFFLLICLAGLLLTGCGGREPISGLRYRVEAGDSLSVLARRADIPVANIIRANELTSRTLRPGQVLILPGVQSLGDDPLDRRFEPSKPAAQQAPQLAIVSREAWGARPLGSNTDPMRTIRRITLHHTHEIQGMDQVDDPELLRKIDAYHIDGRGWAGIGYHFLIGRDGRIYQGRPLTVQGAHARGANNIENLGISVVGDFDHHLPPPIQMEALVRLIEHMRARYAIPRSQVFGHRHFVGTECPGEALSRWLENWKQGR